MKKNFKKITKSPKLLKKKSNAEEIRYLGFVISAELPSSDALTHALVNLKQSPNIWYVAELDADRYPSNIKDSVGRYFRLVFYVAVKAWLCYKSEKILEKKTVILEKDKIGDKLRDWARKDKVKSAAQDFPRVRTAVHDSLFAASGTKSPLNVIWKGKTKPDAIFFWTLQRLQDAGFKSKDDQPFRTVTIKELSPKSECAPENIAELAGSLVIEEYGYSWQDLYRKALIQSIRVDNFIELKAHRHRTSEKDNSKALNGLASSTSIAEKTVKVLRILQDNQKVVLSGPSGSGKTTTLQHMAWQFATKMQTIRGRQVLPLFVPMKWFSMWPQNVENTPQISTYLAFWIKETIDSNLTVSEIKKCDLFKKRTLHGQACSNRKDMLYAIRQLAENFFSNKATDYSDTVLLLDGLNEVPEEFRQIVETQLAQLLKRVDRIVITTRSFHSSSTSGSVTEFELCELSSKQIAEYLSRILEDGEHIFATQIQKDTGILSMARNPFYLSLIGERLKEDPNAKIPDNRASLIKDFIQQSIERKRKEGINLLNQMKDNLLFVILPSVAKWSLDSLMQVERPEPRPFHQSKHFQDIPDSSISTFEALELAEKYGLLKSSGLPAAFYESKQYPEFKHDNIRDYFGALYLQGLNESEFFRTLPERFEYFMWDESLLQFLELGVSEQVVLDVIEYIVPRDLVLASMCVKCAEGIGHALILELERKIRESKNYEARVEFLPDNFNKKYCRPISFLLPMNILSRLPFQSLIELSLKPDQNGSPGSFTWFAIGENVTQENLVQLEELWDSLPQDDFVNRFGVFYAICNINTYSAFKRAINIYKQVHAEPEQNPQLAKFLISSFLTCIKYTPSASEALAEFPIKEYERELHALSHNINVGPPEDLPLLMKLMSSTWIYSADKITEQIVKDMSKDAIPILLEFLSTKTSADDWGGHNFWEYHIFEMILDLDPKQAFKIILDRFRIDDERYASNVRLWQLLVKTQEEDLITHAIACTCCNDGEVVSYFCTDFIE